MTLKALRSWRAKRKQKKLDKYAGEYGHMDRRELQRLREEHSPARGDGPGGAV